MSRVEVGALKYPKWWGGEHSNIVSQGWGQLEPCEQLKGEVRGLIKELSSRLNHADP